MKCTSALPALAAFALEATFALCAPVGYEPLPFERTSLVPAKSASVSSTSSKDLRASASWKQKLKHWFCFGPTDADNFGVKSNGLSSLADCVAAKENSDVPYPYPPKPLVAGGKDFDFEGSELTRNPAVDYPDTPEPSRLNSDPEPAQHLVEFNEDQEYADALMEEAELTTAMSREHPQLTPEEMTNFAVDEEDVDEPLNETGEEGLANDPRMRQYGTEEDAYMAQAEQDDEIDKLFDSDDAYDSEQGSDESFDELARMQDIEVVDEDAEQEPVYEAESNGLGEFAPEYAQGVADNARQSYIQDLAPGDENIDAATFPKHFDDDVAEQSHRYDTLAQAMDKSVSEEFPIVEGDSEFQEEPAVVEQDADVQDEAVEPAVIEQDTDVQDEVVEPAVTEQDADLQEVTAEPEVEDDVELQGTPVEAETAEEDYFTNPNPNVAQNEYPSLDVEALQEEANIARKKSEQLAASIAGFLHNRNQ